MILNLALLFSEWRRGKYGNEKVKDNSFPRARVRA